MTPNADLVLALKACHMIYSLEGQSRKEKKKSLFSCLEADAPNL